MRNCMEKVRNLLKSRYRCIWIQTYEENEVIEELKQIINLDLQGTKLKAWSLTGGLQDIPLNKHERVNPADPKINEQVLFKLIQEAQNKNGIKDETLWILKDLHLIVDKPPVRRALRDAKESYSSNYNPIIVISPIVDIPKEWEKLFAVIDYDLPDSDLIAKIVRAVCKSLGDKIPMPSDENVETIVRACQGLTKNEIIDVLKQSAVEYKSINTKAIIEQKIQLIKKNGILEYKVPNFDLKDIGGNEVFKEWYEESKFLFTDEAASFGCAKPKGYLSVGVPGCAKTMFAEAIANDLKIPFIKLKLSKIMAKLVGESERNMIQALKVVKACAPCVMLIDEIEKALGGMLSSASSDSGTLSRVGAELLEFLNDNDNGVFVVMTANDVSQLPPELTRAGRIDTSWYFSLPNEEERKQIFNIHLDKTKKKYSKDILEKAARATVNYTGAEIEQIVKTAMRKAYKRFLTDKIDAIKEDDVLNSVAEIIPVYESSKEKIAFLEQWSTGRCRRTNASSSLDDFNYAVEDKLAEELRREGV